MKSFAGTFAGLFCGTLLVAALLAPARADVIDDLLAGKPLGETPAARQSSEPSGGEPVHAVRDIFSEEAVSSDHTSSGHTSSGHGTHSAEMHVKLPTASITEEADGEHLVPASGPMSLVPEPSAIILASLALGYFLVFFRRRYA